MVNKLGVACALLSALLCVVAARAEISIHSVRDFDGDGREDLVSVCDGAVWIQQMDGTAVVDAGSVGDGGGAWTLRAIGDLDGDGDSDLVFEGASFVRVVLMAGVAVQQEGFVSNGAGVWAFRALADVDGDGRDDLLLENGSFVRIDVMNGVVSTSRGWVSTGAGAFPLRFAADVSGDGKADLIGEGTSNVRVQLLDGTAVTSTGRIANGNGAFSLDAHGDFDGDGREDLYFGRDQFVTSRITRTDTMNGVAVTARSYGFHAQPLDFEAFGDREGDGIARFVRARSYPSPELGPPIQVVHLAAPLGTMLTIYGANGAVRGLGDYDGDGLLDLARESASSFAIDRIGAVGLIARADVAKPDASCSLFP